MATEVLNNGGSMLTDGGAIGLDSPSSAEWCTTGEYVEDTLSSRSASRQVAAAMCA